MTMAWIAVGTAVVSTAYGAYSSNEAGKAGAAQSRVAGASAISEAAMDQEMRELEARDIKKAAAEEAGQVKRQAILVRGSIVVAQSGSGVMIGEGSAQGAIDQLDALSSADALAALYSGVNKRAATRQGGRFALTAGQEKAKAYGLSAGSQLAAGQAAMVGGLLSAGSQLAGGYAKNTTPAKKG